MSANKPSPPTVGERVWTLRSLAAQLGPLLHEDDYLRLAGFKLEQRWASLGISTFEGIAAPDRRPEYEAFEGFLRSAIAERVAALTTVEGYNAVVGALPTPSDWPAYQAGFAAGRQAAAAERRSTLESTWGPHGRIPHPQRPMPGDVLEVKLEPPPLAEAAAVCDRCETPLRKSEMCSADETDPRTYCAPCAALVAHRRSDALAAGVLSEALERHTSAPGSSPEMSPNAEDPPPRSHSRRLKPNKTPES